LTELKQARKTALSVGGVLLAIGAWSLWRHHPLRAEILGGAGLLLCLLGFVAPRLALPFHVAWMKFAGVLGYINSRIILSVMYYGVLAPIGAVLRLLGRDPLNRRRAPSESYWIPRPKPRQDREQFERLF
jgi:hypothetical protein